MRHELWIGKSVETLGQWYADWWSCILYWGTWYLELDLEVHELHKASGIHFVTGLEIFALDLGFRGLWVVVPATEILATMLRCFSERFLVMWLWEIRHRLLRKRSIALQLYRNFTSHTSASAQNSFADRTRGDTELETSNILILPQNEQNVGKALQVTSVNS